MRHLRERLSPALVLSIIAVILAIGGTAFALGKNTVGSRQIRNHSIKDADIKPKSIRGLFIAYANVNQNGTVDSSHSKGIASCEHHQSERWDLLHLGARVHAEGRPGDPAVQRGLSTAARRSSSVRPASVPPPRKSR